MNGRYICLDSRLGGISCYRSTYVAALIADEDIYPVDNGPRESRMKAREWAALVAVFIIGKRIH